MGGLQMTCTNKTQRDSVNCALIYTTTFILSLYYTDTKYEDLIYTNTIFNIYVISSISMGPLSVLFLHAAQGSPRRLFISEIVWCSFSLFWLIAYVSAKYIHQVIAGPIYVAFMLSPFVFAPTAFAVLIYSVCTIRDADVWRIASLLGCLSILLASVHMACEMLSRPTLVI